MDLSIVIPCCNEADAVPDLVTRLFPVIEQLRRERSVEVIFVDDGSKDRTHELLQEITAGQLDMRIARHSVNQGVGAAVRTGFAQAQGHIVVVTDSDGTYRFESIPTLLGLLKPGVDIVTASPYHRLGGIDNVPAYRIFLSRSSSLIYQVLVDWHISTYTAMYRAYRLDVVRRVPFNSNGFLSAAELFDQLFPSGVQMTGELLADLEQWARLISKLAADGDGTAA